MFKIATPVSHLFNELSQADVIFEHSDCLEVRDESIETDPENIELFHCDIQPIHRLREDAFDYLKKKKGLYPQLELVTFHCASNFDQPTIKEGMFVAGGNQYSREDMFENAKRNFSLIKNIFGDSVALGIENNNYYPTSAYQHITDPEFISTLVMDNDVFLLFDIAHARITAQNRNIAYTEYKNKMPLARMIQIHISAFAIERGLARDTHDAPGEDILIETRDMISQCNPKYVTVEYYKNYDILLSVLRKIRGIQNELSGQVT